MKQDTLKPAGSRLSLLKLYLALRRNLKLSERRSPLFEQNKVGKVFLYIGLGFTLLYLIFIGTMLGWGTRGGDFTLLFGVMPFLLTLDFFMRFGMQQTPAMLVKPYITMPLMKGNIIDCFLITNILSAGNLIWMGLFLPYVYICFWGGLSFWEGIGMLALLWLMITTNSQWYLLVRTLVNHKIWWWWLPGIVYLAIYGYAFIDVEKWAGTLIECGEDYGFSWTTAAVCLVVCTILYFVNRRLQLHFIYEEISRQEKTKLKHVSQFTFLNRFGQIGEYLKLEIKSTMRNKTVKQRFIQGIIIITMLSLLLAFTDVYDGRFSTNIWCLYCFVFFGAVNLTKVMCPEGNYIDLLMVHEENILTLLRAKYYYYCAVLLLPFLITLVPVIMGKFSLIMVLAYLFTVTGPIYFLLFQMAIYNKQTLPLNEKLTGKNQMENKWQIIVSMTTMFAPVIMISLLQLVFSADVAYWILFLTGVAITFTEPYWLRSIYRRMMVRRYENLEGFHSTR